MKPQLHSYTMQIHFSFAVDTGWREEPYSECSEVCGNGTRRKLKYCDAPHPSAGGLCSCNNSNPYEECNGLLAVIEEPCYEMPCQGMQ